MAIFLSAITRCLEAAPSIEFIALTAGEAEIRFTRAAGFYYSLEQTNDITESFTSVSGWMAGDDAQVAWPVSYDITQSSSSGQSSNVDTFTVYPFATPPPSGTPKTLVTWTVSGVDYKALIDQDYTMLPPVISMAYSDISGGVALLVGSLPWNEVFLDFTPESLPTDQQTVLGRLTSHYSEIVAAGSTSGNPNPLSALGETQFFRLQVMAADSDEDGLDWALEVLQYGTDPDESDTDGDGASDGAEVGWGLNPLIADTDADLDGLPDSWESAHGLSSSDSDDALEDLDNDYISNREEFNSVTNPLDAFDDAPGILIVAKGQNQKSWKNRMVLRPLIFNVTNAKGMPISGEAVSLSISAGGLGTTAVYGDATSTTLSANTDALGNVKVYVRAPNTHLSDYTITASHTADAGTVSASTTLRTLGNPNVATAPTALALSIDGQELQVSWTDASSNEEEFVIERKEGTSGVWEPVGVVEAGETDFTDTKAVYSSANVSYRVTATTDDAETSTPTGEDGPGGSGSGGVEAVVAPYAIWAVATATGSGNTLGTPSNVGVPPPPKGFLKLYSGRQQEGQPAPTCEKFEWQATGEDEWTMYGFVWLLGPESQWEYTVQVFAFDQGYTFTDPDQLGYSVSLSGSYTPAPPIAGQTYCQAIPPGFPRDTDHPLEDLGNEVGIGYQTWLGVEQIAELEANGYTIIPL